MYLYNESGIIIIFLQSYNKILNSVISYELWNNSLVLNDIRFRLKRTIIYKIFMLVMFTTSLSTLNRQIKRKRDKISVLSYFIQYISIFSFFSAYDYCNSEWIVSGKIINKPIWQPFGKCAFVSRWKKRWLLFPCPNTKLCWMVNSTRFWILSKFFWTF